MKNLSLSLLCSLVLLNLINLLNKVQAQSPTFGFAKQYGSTFSDQMSGLTSDGSGNLIFGGIFTDSTDMDPGPGNYILYGNSNLTLDGFICKVDSGGNPLWAYSIGGQRTDEVLGVATDPLGNVYACGHFRDTVDFNPGAGVFNLISTLNPLGFFQEDGFVVKYDSAGNFRWAVQIPGPRVQQCTTVVADAMGNVYVAGDFTDTLDLDPGAPVVQRVAASTATDMFLIKLDSSGNYVWGFTLGAGYAERAATLCIDPNGDILLGGTFGQTVDFDPGSGTSTLNAGNSEDGFIAKYSPSGNLIWVINMASNPGGSGVEKLITDPAGTIYVTGLFSMTCNFNMQNPGDTLVSKGIYDAFIGKYSSTGQYIWVKGYGGTADDRFHVTALSGYDKLFTTGRLADTIDFDPGPGISNLISLGSGDAYLLELDSAGNFVSVGQMGGTGNDYGRGIVVDAASRVVSGGFFMGTGDFNPGAGQYNMTSAGSQDMYLTILHQQVVITQVSEQDSKVKTRTYPNPASEYLRIDGQDSQLNYRAELLDTQGRVILQTNLSDTNNQINIINQVSGVYYLKLISAAGTSIHKVIVE
jgi:hypothetical protein